MKYYCLRFQNDVRQCRMEGDFYVHILNPSFRIHRNDPRILGVTTVIEPPEPRRSADSLKKESE